MLLNKHLQSQGVAVSTITGYSPSEYIPLRWGEVVPLWFLEDSLNQVNHTTKYIILSLPFRRHDPPQFLEECKNIGKHIFTFINSLPQSVAIVISGDGAHTHLPSGPYQFSEYAVPFDNAISKWIITKNTDYLLLEMLLN